MSLSPTPWVQTVAYNAVGNITSKSDVGTYSYPAPGQPKPHGVTSITGGVINTTFTYDTKGNMTSGNGLTVAYTSYNKTATITRGTTSIGFAHDTEHQRYSQLGPSGETLYLAGGGVFAERFAGLGGGGVQWTNYLIVGGRAAGRRHIQKADETTATRYFHTDHLGSISVITKENGMWWSASPTTPGASGAGPTESTTRRGPSPARPPAALPATSSSTRWAWST